MQLIRDVRYLNLKSAGLNVDRQVILILMCLYLSRLVGALIHVQYGGSWLASAGSSAFYSGTIMRTGMLI